MQLCCRTAVLRTIISFLHGVPKGRACLAGCAHTMQPVQCARFWLRGW